MKLLIVFTCLIMFTGCDIDKILHSEKHDTKKLGKIYNRNGKVVAYGCSMWFPFKPIDTFTTEIKTGNEQVNEYENYGEDKKPVIIHKNDTVIIKRVDTLVKYREIYKRDTIIKTRTITVLDSPSLAHKQGKIDSLIANSQSLTIHITKAKTQRNVFMWLFFGSLVVSGAILYFKPKMLFK